MSASSNIGHDRQSTFGIGKALDEKQWHSVFRQLVAKSLVEVDFEGHGSLKMTDACRPVLRGEQRLMLRKDVHTGKSKSSGREHRQPDSALWSALRAKRTEIANRQDVPPYVIFHDATLQAMMERHPKTLRQFALIPGVGERKLELYGEDFLAVLARFKETESKSEQDTHTETLDLFKLGFNVRQIAEKRGLKEETIYNHLAKNLEMSAIPLDEVVPLPVQEIRDIEMAILNLPDEQKNALKPVYEQFNGAYSYGILRCVRAALQQQIKYSVAE